ncbi:MAG: hypothetical protein LBT32_02615 [Peptococcaceae bacterium]|nr:hypothetical protein [Peptococcaceae bacterium]
MDVVTLAKRFVNSCGINWPVREIFRTEKAQEAVYDPKRKEFRVNTEKIFLQANLLEMPMEDYLVLVLCHKIGQYLDPDYEEAARNIHKMFRFLQEFAGIESELLEAVMQREQRAENFGEQFVPARLLAAYHNVEQKNLCLAKQRTEIEIIEFKQKCRRMAVSDADKEYYGME